MGAFVLAAIILVGTICLAVFVAFAEGMATAPQYDNLPRNIFVSGVIIAMGVASSHWWHWSW